MLSHNHEIGHSKNLAKKEGGIRLPDIINLVLMMTVPLLLYMGVKARTRKDASWKYYLVAAGGGIYFIIYCCQIIVVNTRKDRGKLTGTGHEFSPIFYD